MFSLGKSLREKRESKLLTVQEVAQITKIKEVYISALENEMIDDLPARVYTIGFIQNLASLYQLPADQLIIAYDALRSNFSTSEGKESKSGFLFRKKEEARDSSYSTMDSVKKLSLDEYSPDKEETLDYINALTEEKEESGKTEKTSKESLQSFKDSFIQDKELQNLKDQIEKEAEEEAEKDFPTSKIVLEFEALMKEEERSETQKIRKQLLEQNIQKTRSMKRDFFKKGESGSKGPTVMIIILLAVAFLLLIYIIVTALLS